MKKQTCKNFRYVPCVTLIAAFVMNWAMAAGARAETTDAPQSLDDAWWTGPLVAYSAHSLPQGHILIEPYFYDVSTGHANTLHSFTYFLYGATDRLTVGLAPDIAFTSARGAPDSSGVHLGDTTLRAQYMLTAMDPSRGIPDLALAVLQNLPTGKYDRLDRSSDGFGGGSYATTIALYSQMAWWMPNGRILRTRLNLAEIVSPRVPVFGASVYGTDTGFAGHVQPGSQFSATLAFEYSLTRNWVPALDLIYSHGNITATRGFETSRSIILGSGSSDAFGFAPTLEYNWSANLGILAGVRIFPAGHNSRASVTPAIAINYVD